MSTTTTHWRAATGDIAVNFALQYDTLEAAWTACPRADWMLEMFRRCATRFQPGDKTHRSLVRAAAEIARTVLPIYERRYPDDPRPRAAIEAAEGWAADAYSADAAVAHATAADVSDADAAHAAASAAYVAAGVYAASAVYAAYVAAIAAYLAAGVYAAAAATTRKQQADIVRRYFPAPPFTLSIAQNGA